MIPESFIQELLHRVDIVDLIDKHVPLKKAGANYAACCPFHNEKTPSFTVSPTKQFYHCFGCGAHGTAIGFLMEYSGLGFVDAVRDLAQQVGRILPVLFETEHDGSWVGHSDNYCLVRVAGDDLRGLVKNVKISAVSGQMLVGDLV